ncbi:unnamed protein product [Blepharisma stoltei]|uniref:Uncharacterized protein n=1 Tax=Blepharisma stoltei TaxID=1481888 RepID=A0AAU9JPH4_9CILI|nr:unnamed protein product [Blepharisma stoltei]
MKRFEVSSGTKRRRQEELLSELDQEKAENRQLRKRLKEAEYEIAELNRKISLDTLAENGKEGDQPTLEVYRSIKSLKRNLKSSIENCETKDRKIQELISEISRLNDELDISISQLNDYKNKESRYNAFKEKIDRLGATEIKNKELEEQYEQSVQDKTLLLIELQKLRLNEKNSEKLEKEIEDMTERYVQALAQISEKQKSNEILKNMLEDKTRELEKMRVLEGEVAMLRNKYETPFSSQRTSLGTDAPPLWIEEYELKLKELQNQNQQLKNTLWNNIEVCTLDSLMAQIETLTSIKEDSFLKYARLQCSYHELEYRSEAIEESLKEQIHNLTRNYTLLEAKLEYQKVLNQELDSRLNNCKSCQELREELKIVEDRCNKLNSRLETRTDIIEQEQKRLKDLRLLYENGVKELDELKQEHYRLKEKFERDIELSENGNSK